MGHPELQCEVEKKLSKAPLSLGHIFVMRKSPLDAHLFPHFLSTPKRPLPVTSCCCSLHLHLLHFSLLFSSARKKGLREAAAVERYKGRFNFLRLSNEDRRGRRGHELEQVMDLGLRGQKWQEEEEEEEIETETTGANLHLTSSSTRPRQIGTERVGDPSVLACLDG